MINVEEKLLMALGSRNVVEYEPTGRAVIAALLECARTHGGYVHASCIRFLLRGRDRLNEWEASGDVLRHLVGAGVLRRAKYGYRVKVD
jgi:hypothetical protein